MSWVEEQDVLSAQSHEDDIWIHAFGAEPEPINGDPLYVGLDLKYGQQQFMYSKMYPDGDYRRFSGWQWAAFFYGSWPHPCQIGLGILEPDGLWNQSGGFGLSNYSWTTQFPQPVTSLSVLIPGVLFEDYMMVAQYPDGMNTGFTYVSIGDVWLAEHQFPESGGVILRYLQKYGDTMPICFCTWMHEPAETLSTSVSAYPSNLRAFANIWWDRQTVPGIAEGELMARRSVGGTTKGRKTVGTTSRVSPSVTGTDRGRPQVSGRLSMRPSVSGSLRS